MTVRLILLLFLGTVAGAEAQAVEARVGRLWDSDGWVTYRLGVARPLAGVFGVQVHGDVTKRFAGEAGGFAGVGADLTVFRKREGGAYLLVGMSGGLGSESSNSFSDPWGSWSAGVGYELLPLSFLSVGAEGRWRELSLGGRDGAELALGVALHFGGSSSRGKPFHREPRRETSAPAAEAPPPQDQFSPRTLADSVVATAAAAMGRPYEFGGTGANGEGFDCSGLIQYAYAKHGIALPRRSTDQARQGVKVDRKLSRLKAGDLLTFSNRGRSVTHVGLYVGEGRFIHSATRGVQVSTLSAEDPYGRWWYQRWVGVRRIIQ